MTELRAGDRRRLEIDADRLYRALLELGRIGGYEDPATGLAGVNRLALTDADAAGRRQVGAWFEQAGLSITVDAIGNVYGRREGRDPSLAPVLCGSHIDSVPTGGAFDGALGVLGSLEIVRVLNDAGATTLRPVVVGFFTDEEGCRFGTDMLGSAVAAGRIPLEQAYELGDRDGVSVRDELARIGFLGSTPVDAMRPYAYVECHIEQGPILARQGLDVGVVTGVQAISWHELTIHARSAHAGTTPIEYRHDPGLAAARINVALRELATSGRFGAEMRATMGRITPVPGMVNVVPARVTATVDLRNPDDAAMARAEDELRALCAEVERLDGVRIESRQTARTAAVAFDETVQGRIAGVAAALGLRHAPILSGAGHDAQEWASVAKTGMVFVPGEHDGISHNPRELSTREQCANGVRVLLDTVLALADET